MKETGCSTGLRDGYEWRCRRGLPAIEELAGEWNRLAHSNDHCAWSDANWMRCYWRAFGSAGDELVVHALYKDGTLFAVAPLLRSGGVLAGWRSVGNVHTCYWVVALDESRLPELAGSVLDHLLAGTDVLDVKPVHSKGPVAEALISEAKSRRLKVAVEEYTGDVLLDVPTSWADCRAALGKNLRGDTGRKLRRLEKLGHLEFERWKGGPSLDAVLAECYRVESLGWKAETGSPILQNPETTMFYTELARSAALEGRLAIYTLRLDSKLIAFEYCLRAQGAIEMLKLSFDPSLSAYSPGNVLRYLLLEQEANEGAISSYHLGRPADASGWKLRWASRVEPLCRLRIYGGGLKPSLAYALGPGLRGTLKKSVALRRAVRWARSIAFASAAKRDPTTGG